MNQKMRSEELSYTAQVWKTEKYGQKRFTLLRPLIFVVKDTYTKGLPMLHCTDFVAYSYPGYELKYIDLIFMWQRQILAVMTLW